IRRGYLGPSLVSRARETSAPRRIPWLAQSFQISRSSLLHSWCAERQVISSHHLLLGCVSASVFPFQGRVSFSGFSGNRVGSWKDVGGSQGSPLLYPSVPPLTKGRKLNGAHTK